MLHVAEQNIDLVSASTMNIAQTVLMDLDATGDSFSVERWSEEDEIHDIRFAVWDY